MRIFRALATALLLPAAVLSQSAADQLFSSTIGIASYDPDRRLDETAHTFSVGFLIDEIHLATSFNACCRSRGGTGGLEFAAIVSKDRRVLAKLIWSSAGKDIAILRLEEPTGKRPATLYPSNFLKAGDRLYALHYGATGGYNFKPQLKTATITGKTVWQNSAAIKTDLGPSQTNDGAPLVNGCGAVAAFRVNSADPTAIAVLASEIIPAAETAGVRITSETQPCTREPDAALTGTAPPGSGAPGKPPGETDSSRSSNTVWIAISAGGVLAIAAASYFIARRRRPASVRSRGPVLTSQLPKLQRGLPYQPGTPPPFAAARPIGFLSGVSGEYKGLRLDLGTRPIIIGRDPKAANLVLANETVSSLHCSVSYDSSRGEFVLKDLGSANGTRLAAGKALAPNVPHNLKPGSEFSVGDLKNRFQVVTEEMR